MDIFLQNVLKLDSFSFTKTKLRGISLNNRSCESSVSVFIIYIYGHTPFLIYHLKDINFLILNQPTPPPPGGTHLVARIT